MERGLSVFDWNAVLRKRLVVGRARGPRVARDEDFSLQRLGARARSMRLSIDCVSTQ